MLSLLLAQSAQQTANVTDNTTLIWATVLTGLAIIFFMMELFIPSGGILGSIAAVCVVSAIILFFWVDTTFGLISCIVALIALPVALGIAMRVWPNTPIGRIMTLSDRQPADVSRIHPTPPKQDGSREQLVGKEGRTVTDLRPVGTCTFDGKRYECLSVSSTISSGNRVRVISVDGMQIKVDRIRAD